MQTGHFQLWKTPCAPRLMQLLQSWNPLHGRPKVARSSQPWAIGCNPFGIGFAGWRRLVGEGFGCGSAALRLCGSNYIVTAQDDRGLDSICIVTSASTLLGRAITESTIQRCSIVG